jgi:hypothetical protein
MIVVAPQSVDLRRNLLPPQPDQPTDRGGADQDLRQREGGPSQRGGGEQAQIDRAYEGENLKARPGARYCCVVRPGREEEGNFSHVGVLLLKASGHAWALRSTTNRVVSFVIPTTSERIEWPSAIATFS